MSYNIENLDARLKNYLETNGVEVISKVYFDSESAKYFDIQTGVKGGLEKPIITLDHEVVLADGSSCGFEAQGGDTFSQRTLKGQALKVNKEFCAKDLMSSWAHAETKANAIGQADALPFEAQLINGNLAEIARKNGRLLWEGKKTSGDLIDGIITLTKTADGTKKYTAEENETIYARCKRLYMVWDNTIGLTPKIWMSLTNFKKLIQELVDLNLYHVFEKQDSTYSIMLPGFDVEIKGLSDITSDDIVLCPQENLVMGVDAENDAEVVDLWFDKSDRTFKFVVEYALSVNFRIADYMYIMQA